MVKKLFFLSIFLFALNTVAQSQKWSLEANYLITLDDSDDPLRKNNPGIADLGIKYRFFDRNVVKIGFGLNVGVFQGDILPFDESTGSNKFRVTDWLVQPKLFAEFQLPGLSKLRPSLGVGYTFIHSRFNGNGRVNDGDPAESVNDIGLNLNIGLTYDLTKSLFIQAQYDYIRLKDENNTINIGNSGFLKVGVGFRF